MDAIKKAGSNGTPLQGDKPRGEPRVGTPLRAPELRYQRLFETSHDGIIILDATTGRIIDTNPFMTHLLGFSHDEFVGKQLWEVGLVRDAEADQALALERVAGVAQRVALVLLREEAQRVAQ